MTNIDDVHNEYSKHLYLETYHLIDVALATCISVDENVPLWIVPIATTGYGKTEQVKPLMNLSISPTSKYNIMLLDQLTSKSWASGSRTADEDLGVRLTNKKTFLLFSDMASMLASEEDKKALFATLRTLFDGTIIRLTGEKKRDYRNCWTNMLAFSVPNLKRDLDFMSAMGTREIVYRLPEIKNQEELLKRKLTSKDMDSITVVVKKFLEELTEKKEFPDLQEGDLSFIRGVTRTIATKRVEAVVDKEGYIIEQPEEEVPTRLYKQLIKLFKGLLFIGLDNKAVKRIVMDVGDGCGNKLRRDILQLLYKEERSWERREIANTLNTSPTEVLTQLMILRSQKQVEVVWRPGKSAYADESLWSIEEEEAE